MASRKERGHRPQHFAVVSESMLQGELFRYLPGALDSGAGNCDQLGALNAPEAGCLHGRSKSRADDPYAYCAHFRSVPYFVEWSAGDISCTHPNRSSSRSEERAVDGARVRERGILVGFGRAPNHVGQELACALNADELDVRAAAQLGQPPESLGRAWVRVWAVVASHIGLLEMVG